MNDQDVALCHPDIVFKSLASIILFGNSFPSDMIQGGNNIKDIYKPYAKFWVKVDSQTIKSWATRNSETHRMKSDIIIHIPCPSCLSAHQIYLHTHKSQYLSPATLFSLLMRHLSVLHFSAV